jgi:hypothetical protein
MLPRLPYLPVEQYIANRQAYNYNDPNIPLNIIQTGSLAFTGQTTGIFSQRIPVTHPNGINLRRFEMIVQEVFRDCFNAQNNNAVTPAHIDNLRSIVEAIVHWKLVSQGGRAGDGIRKVRNGWDNDSYSILMNGYNLMAMPSFKIPGIAIAIATAFMRFLDPINFGVMDSRVVGTHTNPNGITALSIRARDNYINNTGGNDGRYITQYIPFLRAERDFLNNMKVTFVDIDANDNNITSNFRACDIEMALFV